MPIDVVCGLMLLTAAWRGYRRGLAAQVVHAAGLVVGLMVSVPLAHAEVDRFEPILNRLPERAREPSLQIGLMLVLMLLVWLIGGLLLRTYRKKVLKATEPSKQDRSFGIASGLAMCGVWISLMLSGLSRLPDSVRPEETLAPYLDASRVVATHRRMPVGDWILDSTEVQQTGTHLRVLGSFLGHALSDQVDPGPERPTLRR